MKLILFWLLIWSANCVIIYTNGTNQNSTFDTTETKLYVPVATLSTQDNAKLLPQLKSSFKRIINWDKYLSKLELIAQHPNLNHLLESRFQGVNRLFVLAFEKDAQRTSNKGGYLANVEINDYNVIIDEKNYFDKPVINNEITYENIRKFVTRQGDDYTTGCLYVVVKNQILLQKEEVSGILSN